PSSQPPLLPGSSEKACPMMECKIHYQRFTAHSCKPKILNCLPRTCARCSTKIIHVGDRSPCVSCPFCCYETGLLTIQTLIQAHTKRITSMNSDYGSSNCFIITIMEVKRDSLGTPSQSSASDYYADHGTESYLLSSQDQLDQDLFSKLHKHAPRILVSLLGLLYFGSLPLGIYVLVIQKVSLRFVCVSVVPSSLTVCLVYGFCQCLCSSQS
uniref:RING-type E3 ubiquitin transferase n=1 Tax=Melopsittacus undulatus TaxID=13146 RepID=A0A8C6JXU5_MELUD